MNWKLRLQNKATLTALIAFVIAFIYQVLGLFNIAPVITEDETFQTVGMLIEILAGLGILVDPTTQGIGDSERAMEYLIPNKPELPDDYFESAQDIEFKGDDDDE